MSSSVVQYEDISPLLPSQKTNKKKVSLFVFVISCIICIVLSSFFSNLDRIIKSSKSNSNNSKKSSNNNYDIIIVGVGTSGLLTSKLLIDYNISNNILLVGIYIFNFISKINTIDINWMNHEQKNY